jgi:hypothetical protein
MITTFSKFNYGFNITSQNNLMNFSEGGPELTAELSPGSYTFGEFALAIQSALNADGALDYTLSLNRSTNKITISASGVFSLLLSSGSNIGLSPFELMGFTQVVDLTGANTYIGQDKAGFEYYPQFLLQSYVPAEHFKESSDATINTTASGRVEVVRFGIDEKIEMDIKFITNLPMDGHVIKNNPSGLDDALDFLSDISQKRRFEFVPDVDVPGTFNKVILESAPGFNNGTGFKLRELYSQNLPNIYETGLLTLRVVT